MWTHIKRKRVTLQRKEKKSKKIKDKKYMERTEIFNQLNNVFADVLDLDEVELTDTTTADDIEEWDSLSHIQLVVAVEKAFNIKFTSLEIMKWSNVGEMVDSIERLTAID